MRAETSVAAGQLDSVEGVRRGIESDVRPRSFSVAGAKCGGSLLVRSSLSQVSGLIPRIGPREPFTITGAEHELAVSAFASRWHGDNGRARRVRRRQGE